MTEPLGVAILGAGIFARSEHLPAVLDNSDLVLKAVYSRSRASAESLRTAAAERKAGSENHIDVYYDVDNDTSNGLSALFARADIKAVIVVLPINTQPQVIRTAILAGKHVLSEKPIAKDVGTATELWAWYGTQIPTGVPIWSVAENYRFNQHYEYAAGLVKSLGKTSFFSYQLYANVQPGNKYFETEWRKIPDYQGGFLLDGGVHHAAALRQVLGSEVEKVSAFTSQVQPHLPPLDTFHATLRLTNGTTGTFAMSFGSSKPLSEFTIIGENGSVTINSATVTHYDIEGKEVAKKEFPIGASAGVHAEVAAFAKAIINGKQDEKATPIEALRDLALIEAILESGKKDGETLPVFH